MVDVTKITSGSLIAAEQVNGTDVYNTAGEHLGTVDDIMIDKISGKAIYAVMAFGGFLGIGEKQHPLPWSSLTYDQDKEGFIVNLDKRMMSPSLRATQASGHVRPSRASRQDEKDAATAPPELSGGAPHPVQPEQRGKLHPRGASSQVLRRRAAGRRNSV